MEPSRTSSRGRNVAQPLQRFITAASSAKSCDNVVDALSPVKKGDASLRGTLLKLNEKYKQMHNSGTSTAASSTVNSFDTAPDSRQLLAPTYNNSNKLNESESFIKNLKNKIAYLRHSFNKADASGSGKVNAAEFRTTLKQAGYANDDERILKHMFDSNSQDVPNGASYGTHAHWKGYRGDSCQGKVVDFQKFLKKLEATSNIAEMDKRHVNTDYIPTESSSTASREPDEGPLPSSSLLTRPRSASFSLVTDQIHSTVIPSSEERRILRRALVSTRDINSSTKLFKDLSDDPASGRLSVKRFKEGLTRLGTNITDAEADVVVEKVGVKADGCIDMADFDLRLRESVEYFDRVASLAAQGSLHRHRRYSDSFRSHEGLITPLDGGSTEYADGIKESSIHRRDVLSWSKVKRAFQENRTRIVSDMKDGVIIDQLAGNLTGLGVSLGSDDIARLQRKLYQASEGDLKLTGRSKVSLDILCEVVGIALRRDQQGRPVCVDDVGAVEGIFASSSKSVLGSTSVSSSMLRGDHVVDRGFIPKNVKRHAEKPVYEHTFEPHKYWNLSHNDPRSDLTSAMPDILWKGVHATGRQKWGQPSRRTRSSSAPPARSYGPIRDSLSVAQSAPTTGSIVPPRWANKTLAEFIISNNPADPGQDQINPYLMRNAKPRKASMRKLVVGNGPLQNHPFDIN